MYALIVKYDRQNTSDEPEKQILSIEDLVALIDESTYIAFETKDCKGNVYFFDSKEEAENN